MRKMKESNEARKTKYFTRATFRLIKLLISLFILFLVISGIVYFGPKIWSFAITG